MLYETSFGPRRLALPILLVLQSTLVPAAPRGFPELAGEPSETRLEDEEVIFFEKNVRPLLAERCYGCHSARAKRLRGGLLLDQRAGWERGGDSGAVIVPGDPEESLLIRAVRYSDKDLQMPPKGKLSRKDIELLEKWVEMGAPDPRGGEAVPSAAKIDRGEVESFWAFRPPERHSAPRIKRQDWGRTWIDAFILARLEERGIEPVRDTTPAALISRVTLDLTGLRPTPEEIRRFVKEPSEEAFAAVVDRLLASQQFGEHWGRHWLDVARYAESVGSTRNYPFRYAWRYRDYVVRSFNADKPFDRFLQEQLAGDLLPASDDESADEQRVATGFLALGVRDLNERNVETDRMEVVSEQLDTLSRAVLALTVGCARCHDHKFDPIPTVDYYALAGIFESTELLSGLSNRSGNNKYLRNDLLWALSDAAPREEPAPAPRQERLEKQLRALRREIQTLQRERRQAESRQLLRAKRRELKNLQKRLASFEDTASIPEHLAMGVRDGKRIVDCRVRIRGEPRNRGEAVPRGFLQAVCWEPVGDLPEDSSGRLDLAFWLTDRRNPLTARVFVNRVWHHLFGRGLVPTVDNFGRNGELPSHPELLDTLAVKFMEEGWSVKKLVRELVLSRVYRLALSDVEQRDKNDQIDPDNELLWRAHRRRLAAEVLRDTMLQAAGRLDLRPPAGSPVQRLPNREVRGGEPVLAAFGGSRRSVYIPVLRGQLPPMWEIFDFPDSSEVSGRRASTTVPTQALFLMNDSFVVNAARGGAKALLSSAGADASDAELVSEVYLRTVGRLPSGSELDRARSYLRDGVSGETSAKALASLFHAQLAGAEFRYRP